MCGRDGAICRCGSVAFDDREHLRRIEHASRLPRAGRLGDGVVPARLAAARAGGLFRRFRRPPGGEPGGADGQQTGPRDFLTVATPGAGKTTFALRLARELMERRVISAITIVCPTEHLKRQWAESAARVGIKINPEYQNGDGPVGKDFHGVAVTYATVAARPALHRNRTESRKSLVIFDEVHHAGDGLSWGDAVREAFEPATRRLGLSGTPFRTDINPIPFVQYDEGPDGVRRSRADYTYGYGPALADGVVRPVIFLAYAGEMRWRTRAGDEITATLGEPSPRTRPPRRGAPRSTRRATGSSRSWPPPTAASPSCAAPSPTRAAW